MLVLCNQAFTNDTFMQLVNDKAGILLQYKLEVIYLCIRECSKFMFMGADIFWACGQGYQEKNNRLGREIDPDFLSLHTANNFPKKDSKHLLFMF